MTPRLSIGWLLDALFPPACVGCQNPIRCGALCRACRIKIVPFRTPFCGACATPLPRFRAACHTEVPYLLGAVGDYQNAVLRGLIHALKFRSFKPAAEPLAEILACYFAALPIDVRGFTVIPMPISRERMRERGFNQSALIAGHFSRFFGMPCEEKMLLRTGHRTAQSEIDDRSSRWKNIEGCFAARAAKARKVILIDDVTTSGATFTEASFALRAAGVKKIFALAAAKAI